MAAVGHDGRDRAPVGTNRLQAGNREIDEAAHVPADPPHHSVGIALPTVDCLVNESDAASDPCGLELLAGQSAGVDDLLVKPVDVGE